MLNVNFAGGSGSGLKLLCIGAHSDDIEIGCGGTILRLLEESSEMEMHWIVLGATGLRKAEAVESANLFLENAKRKEIIIKDFRDGFFPYIGAEIKEFFEELKRECSPGSYLNSLSP